MESGKVGTAPIVYNSLLDEYKICEYESVVIEPKDAGADELPQEEPCQIFPRTRTGLSAGESVALWAYFRTL